MNIASALRKWLGPKYRRLFKKEIKLSPKAAYNLLAPSYDEPKFNLLHILDEMVLSSYMGQLNSPIHGILDFGAGTGRNIPFLQNLTKGTVYACDISAEMLRELKKKFPEIEGQLIMHGDLLNNEDQSIDLVSCNLTLGYLEDLDHIFMEWNRILRPDGQIIISDMHPTMNMSGKSRNFKYLGRKLIIKSKVYSEEELISKFNTFGWKVLDYKEIEISRSLRKHFESEESYKLFLGKKVLFSYLLTKIENEL